MNWKTKKVVWTGLLILVAVSLLVWFLVRQEMDSERPIQQVKLTSELKQLTQQELNQKLAPYVGSSFWQVELTQIQADLVRLDWVSQAVVKRSWPDQLIISIEEQVPVARWGESGLINHKGEVFFPKEVTEFSNFVQLDGELENSSQILAKLAEFQTMLDAIEWRISALRLSVEGAWQVQILDGPQLLIAQKQDRAQLQRFVRAYGQLKEELRNSAQVYDLRYSNGFSIKRNSDQ